MTDEGELKKRIWANSDVETAEIKESKEYVADARTRHRTDIISIDNIFDILDEAKKEIPHTHPCYSTDEFRYMREKYDKEVLEWFKKWFGDASP